MIVGERIGLLFGTVRHLKVRQVVNRLTRRWAPRPRLTEPPPCRAPAARLRIPPVAAPVSFLGDGRFRFLNDERRVSPAEYGAPKRGLLWDYNFHYFDGLAAPSPDPGTKGRWIEDWLQHVPAGARPAWDPYPASRRILNWILWAMRPGTILPEGSRTSLGAQVRHLERSLEFHLMANHLLANAVALTAAGAWFGGDEGDRWLESGSRLLRRELNEQFLSDGGHYELSPTYHALILGDLLHLIQIARATGCRPVEEMLLEFARGAASWASAMRRPDGRPPLFNDAAYDQAPPTDDLLAHSEQVLAEAPSTPEPGFTHLEASGYFRFQEGRVFVVGDVGDLGPPYQPGHGHCDMLGFELCWDGAPVVVDTGTSTYETGAIRTRERGTAAHNTVQLGALEQSEIWAGFRVARRAGIETVRSTDDGISARIRGFPPAWSRLERAWDFAGETVRIRDRVLDRGRPGAGPTARLHFHPDVHLVEDSEGRWSANGLALGFTGALSVRNVPYEYAPEFNLRIPARCLEIDFDRELTTVIGP